MGKGLVLLGSCLIAIEMGAWTMTRFASAWWFLEVTQLGVLFAAFMLIVRRIAKLEEKVKAQGNKISGIVAFVREKLDDKPKDRMLRSVS